jgi:hypothetical protein
MSTEDRLLDRSISKDRQINLAEAIHARLDAYIAESNKAVDEARKITDDAAEIELRRLALATVTKKNPAGFRYKGKPWRFVYNEPGQSSPGVLRTIGPLYFALTPAEASDAAEAGELHRTPLGEIKLAGQVFQVFSTETPASRSL